MVTTKHKPTICSVQWDRVIHFAEEGDVEQTLLEIALFMQLDAQEHPAVRGCLERAAEQCRMASFNFYASFK